MPETKKHFEEVMEFIRMYRGNESNFEKLYQKLEEEVNTGSGDGAASSTGQYRDNLVEIKEKQATEYRQTKEKTGTAWPEFEKFVTHFEKSVTEAMKEGA